MWSMSVRALPRTSSACSTTPRSIHCTRPRACLRWKHSSSATRQCANRAWQADCISRERFRGAVTMSQLQNITERHRFDVARLAAFLQDKLPGWTGPLDVKQFQGGQSNPTYLLTVPGQRYVMRSKPGPVAKLLPSAHAVEREFRVMRALASQGIPVPKVYVLCEDESVIGRAFFVMEHVEGRILWDQSLPEATRTERAAIY